MKPKNLFALWGGLFVLCAALGFVNTASTALQVLMTVLSIAFFLPGALLLRLSKETGNREIALLVRNLSAASLILTAVLLIANFLSVFAPKLLGDILHGMLIVVSAPMICSGYWALSMFLWACLMICAIKALK
jgi:hypothetical protein